MPSKDHLPIDEGSSIGIKVKAQESRCDVIGKHFAMDTLAIYDKNNK